MTGRPEPREGFRERFVNRLHAGDVARAAVEARDLLDDKQGPRDWNVIRNELAKIPGLALQPLRVALLSSFSTEFLHAPLISHGFVNGLGIEIYQAGFGQFRQEILAPESGLYRFNPDVVILAVEGANWIPELYSTYSAHSEEDRQAAILRVKQDLVSIIEAFRRCSNAALLVHNFEAPEDPDLGIYDIQIGSGQSRLVPRINDWLAETAGRSAGSYVVDYAGLVARHGSRHWHDERMRQMVQLPIRISCLHHLAVEYMKFFRALTGLAKKCLVVDLDNTLWSGVVGEVGVHGLGLGATYPGSAHVAFQHTLMKLQRRGVLLAIASKNNAADVDEVLSQHPHMVLRPESFACVEINWGAKSESVANISRRLNISVEHIVFADDNPAECAEVRQAHPSVRTICLSGSPETFSSLILDEGLFDSLVYSAEDARRTAMYRTRVQGERAQAAAGSLEDFYRSLQMQIEFGPVRQSTVARSAQLTQKTNQFNATTRRYKEADLLDRMKSSDWLLTTVAVRDRFGDHGIVGLIMASAVGDVLDIDTFLLSCRVIGRSVETAMLAHLFEHAVANQMREIRGLIIPTSRNIPIRDLYQKHYFQGIREDDDGSTQWTLDVSEQRVSRPDWFTVAPASGSLATSWGG